MTSPEKSRRSGVSGRTLFILAAVLGLTLLVSGLLIYTEKPTLVEVRATASRVEFETLPSAQAEDEATGLEAVAPPVGRVVRLFPPTLRVTTLEVQDVDCLETDLEGPGKVDLQVDPGGSFDARTEDPLQPALTLNGPAKLVFSIPSPGQVTLALSAIASTGNTIPPSSGAGASAPPVCRDSASDTPGWSGSLPVGTPIAVRLRSLRGESSALGHLEAGPLGETFSVAARASYFRIRGGSRESRINFALPRTREAATLLRILDPKSGAVSQPQTLPVAMAEARSIAWQERLILLDPVPVEAAAMPLLRSDLKIQGLRLQGSDELKASKSFLVSGEIRFPALEKSPIELEPGTFLSLKSRSRQPFILRSLQVSGDDLKLVLWGEVESLKVGPAPRFQTERLPSYFEWLYMQRLTSLVYGTLAYAFTLVFGSLKIMGWVKG